jgi:hypothetical protein
MIDIKLRKPGTETHRDERKELARKLNCKNKEEIWELLYFSSSSSSSYRSVF